MAPGDLQEVLAVIKPAGHAHHADLLVGLGRADDAAVYRVAPDLAIVETVDFFPPVVDDPYTWGAVAAANAMSDVRSEEHTSELQSHHDLVCRLLLEKKKKKINKIPVKYINYRMYSA